MLSTGAVRRKTGRMVQDETTGLEVPQWLTVHEDVPCRVAGLTRGASTSRTTEMGGVEITEAMRTLHLRYDIADLADGDLVEITAGELAGTAWEIQESDPAEQQTARRVAVVAVPRPTEWDAPVVLAEWTFDTDTQGWQSASFGDIDVAHSPESGALDVTVSRAFPGFTAAARSPFSYHEPGTTVRVSADVAADVGTEARVVVAGVESAPVVGTSLDEPTRVHVTGTLEDGELFVDFTVALNEVGLRARVDNVTVEEVR